MNHFEFDQNGETVFTSLFSEELVDMKKDQ
jgi:hypothetical protein